MDSFNNQENSEIIFITKREDHNISDPRIKIQDNTNELINMLSSSNVFGFDTENTSLTPFEAVPLLDSISDGVKTFVIDRTSITEPYLQDFRYKLFLGHNIQYDCRIIQWHYNIVLTNVYDTMLAEQIIRRGVRTSNSLEATHLRRLRTEMEEDKSTRSGFSSMGINSKFNDQHIRYSAYDAKCLIPIKEEQDRLIKKYDLSYRLHISNQITPVLADMSITGINLDIPKWKQRIEEDKKEKFKIEKELDKEVLKLSKTIPELKGGEFTRNRKKQILTQGSLFDTDVTIENENNANINYGSPKQVLNIFRRAKEPIPTAINKDYEEKASISQKALEPYIIDYPNSRLLDFCKLLIKYAEVDKAINSFGDIFINNYYKKKTKTVRGFLQKKTGKIHTIYKNETTANGRLSSGDTKWGFYNSQQINKQHRYRHCFTLSQEEIDNDWWITTADLSGAELIILAALSGDTKLAELQAKDIHSYLATAAFNKIISYILDKVPEYRIETELYDLLKVNKIYKSKTYLNGEPYSDLHVKKLTEARIKHVIKYGKLKIDKKKWKDIRDPFKNVVYGSSYGAQTAKIATTLNIAKAYAELVKNSMHEQLPIAFGFLDRQSRFGVKNGYITFNKRTNSRHWFDSILNGWKYGQEVNFSDKGKVERACKNYPISGTQADMIKEAMVFIRKFISIYNIKAKFLLQVHDELVIKHKGKEIGEKFATIMTRVANKYLSKGITMKADFDTLKTWTK